jgi:tripartite-type tricarboxylate transporter receptor subunit TctC
MARINIVRIPYKGDGPAMTGLIRGEVQMMFPTASSVLPHLKSGRLKALAVASPQPSVLLPGLPTVASAGLPGFESGTLVGILAPAKTPVAVINRLNQEIVQVLNKPDVREKFLSMGVETIGSSPEQLAATMKAEIAKLSKVIKDAAIRAD